MTLNFEIPILTFIPEKIDADQLRQQFVDLSELAMVEEEDIDTVEFLKITPLLQAGLD